MEMSKTTIDQLSRRNKDETQNSTICRVKNKYLEAQVQTEIFFQCKLYNDRDRGKCKTNLLQVMSPSLLVRVRSHPILVYQSDYWWVIAPLNLIPQNHANNLSLGLYGTYPSPGETSHSISLFRAEISDLSKPEINPYGFEGHFCVHFTKRKKLRQRALKLPVNDSDIAARSLSSLPTIIMPVKIWQFRHFFLRRM